MKVTGCIVAGLVLAIVSYPTVNSCLLGNQPATESGYFAVAQICVQDEGRWGCLEEIEKWVVRTTAAKDRAGPDGFSPRYDTNTYPEALIKLVPANEMLAACPLDRKDECAARLITFGYDRTSVMNHSTPEAIR
jgi:hypothetical protein